MSGRDYSRSMQSSNELKKIYHFTMYSKTIAALLNFQVVKEVFEYRLHFGGLQSIQPSHHKNFWHRKIAPVCSLEIFNYNAWKYFGVQKNILVSKICHNFTWTLMLTATSWFSSNLKHKTCHCLSWSFTVHWSSNQNLAFQFSI